MSRGANIKDIAGQTFGKLTVVATDGWYVPPNGSRVATWICKCACGNQKSVAGTKLRFGSVTSCGCDREVKKPDTTGPRPKTWLPKGEAGFRILLRQYKAGAALRGYVWALTDEQFRIVTRLNCFYCGIEPKQVSSGRKRPGSYEHGAYLYNGIDRMKNETGYTAENIVPCCERCNRAKNTMSPYEFIAWIHSASHFLITRNSV